MSRRNPYRNLSVPSLILIAVVFGVRYWQESQKAANKKTTRTTESRSPQTRDRNSSSRSTSSAPAGPNSSDGNLLLGNLTNAGKADDNYLLERAEYSMSYSRSRGGPNWVSWHTDSSDMGDVKRGKFAPDPDLPSDWQIRPTDYTGGGYDRGHMCPSADRTASREMNNATFYMSNMVPQTADLNQHAWADLENYLRDQIREGNEIYQVAGGSGTAKTIGGGKVAVPQVCWKVAVIMPEGSGDLKRINAKTRVLAIVMPNIEDDRLKNGDWRDYLVTPAKIESAMKVDLFSALPAKVQTSLEAKIDSEN